MASMAFAETETKVTKTLLPFVHHNVKVSWQRRDASNNIDAMTLESFQMPTPTLELSTARGNVVKSATAECMTALDMPSLHSSVLQSTTTAVTASVPKLSARGELGPLHVVLLVDKEELLVWWHMETRRPNSAQTSWSRDTLLSQHRRHCVAPRQTLLDQTEKLPPPLGHCGGMKTTFWSHFVVHVGAGRAKLPHVVEETELLLMSAVADHLLSLRVDLSNWTPSQGDGIQGAEMRTVPSGTGSLQGCYVRIPLLLKMAPKFSRDQRVRDRTTIGEWHRNIPEWVRHISWVDAEAHRAIGRRFHSWAEQRRMHDQTTHEESVLSDASWDWRCNAPKHPVQSTMWKIWISWTSWKNPIFFFFLKKKKKLWKTYFSTDFFLQKKSQALCRTFFVVISSCFEKYPSPAFQKVVSWSLSCFSLKMYFRKYLFFFKKKKFSWTTLNFFYLLLIFFFIFLKKKLFSIFQFSFDFSAFFVLFPPETILKQVDFLQISFCFTDFSFWTFFWEEGHILNKKLFKNYHLNFFDKKESGSCNKPFFSFVTCVDDRMRHSVVVDLARGTPGAWSHLSFFLLFLNKQVVMLKNKALQISFFERFVLPIVDIFWSLCFNCSSLLFMTENHLFLLSSPCFYSHFLDLFFLPRPCHGDLMAGDKKHVIKINEWRQWWEWSPRTYKIIFSWRIFEHDRRSELMDQNQPKRKASADCVWQGLAAIVCSLWLTDLCVWHRQHAGHPLVKACPHLLMFSPSTLILFMFTQDGKLETEAWRKDWATWGGEAEPGGSIFYCLTPCWDSHACNADGQQQKVEWNTCDCRIRKGSGHRYPVPSRSGREPSGEPIFEEEAGNGDTGISVPSLARAITKDGKRQNWVVDTWTKQNQKSSCTGQTSCTFEQEMAWAKVATDEPGRSSGLCRRSKEDRGKAT